MSSLAKLSKQAAQLEHDRQHQKALALYARLFDEAASAEEEVDVALFNRAGDLAMRLGDAARAVGYYERAIDAYAAGGLLNNAIAVCNKVLRHAPDAAATHYTLAVLHAKQGFRGDAKYHYVEYAERMHRAGRDDEALRALGEFAALCPPGDDARAALARHLAKGNRGAEISSRLDAMLSGAAPATAAAPAADVAAASAVTAAAPSDGGVGDLVFLDVSSDAGDPIAAVEGLEFTSVGEPAPAAFVETAVDLPTASEPQGDDVADAGSWGVAESFELGGFETFDEQSAAAPAAGDDPVDLAPDLSLDVTLDLAVDAAPEATLDAGALDLSFEPLDDGPLDDASGEDESLETTFDAAPPAAPRWGADLPGELPPLSLAGWIGSAEPAVIADAPAATEPEPPEALGTAAPAESEFVDLGEWLRASEPAPTTRLTIDDAKPTGDESADFARLLGAFKAGIARNVEADDHAIHYDLGVAFREMGLIDEAIAEFQRAARAPGGELRAGEALGQCFLDRGSPELALTTLRRTLDTAAPAGDAPGEPSVLGVVYLLGEAHARLGQADSARECFERVVAADIEFRDAARRLSQLSAMTP